MDNLRCYVLFNSCMIGCLKHTGKKYCSYLDLEYLFFFHFLKCKKIEQCEKNYI